jgi:hypothetical protein
MKVNPIIFGATGMVGRGVLLECLDSDKVEMVMVVNRRPLGISHPKLNEVVLDKIDDLSGIKTQLAGYDACFFCLGITSVGMKEEQYSMITYDLTRSVAEQMYAANKEMTFCYVSGQSTDSTEKGRVMWARVKGRTENMILSIGFRDAYMFRPGLIIPLRGIKSRTKIYNAVYILLRPFFRWLLRSRNVTDTTRIGKAMINAVYKGSKQKFLENPEINALSREG